MAASQYSVKVLIREIPGFQGYGVSVAGSQVSVWSRWNCLTGLTETWQPIQVSVFRSGHLVAIVRRTGGRRSDQFVHRLALLAFVGPCPPGHVTRHLNDIKQDNRLSNLTWGTKGENTEDRKVNGRNAIGSHVAHSKLTEDQVIEIKRRLRIGHSQAELGREYHVTSAAINSIKRRLTWKHVS